jgi:hypothetical protein
MVAIRRIVLAIFVTTFYVFDINVSYSQLSSDVKQAIRLFLHEIPVLCVVNHSSRGITPYLQIYCKDTEPQIIETLSSEMPRRILEHYGDIEPDCHINISPNYMTIKVDQIHM